MVLPVCLFFFWISNLSPTINILSPRLEISSLNISHLNHFCALRKKSI